MKFLEIKDEEDLCAIFDAALKFGGMTLQATIAKVKSCMGDKNVLELDPEIDKNLYTICDAALKSSGMQVHKMIQELTESIIEKVPEVTS